MYKYTSLLIALVLCQLVFSQKGTITGKVFDEELNDVLPFANIAIKGTSIGTTSDFDGNYSIPLDPGTYSVVFSFVGYVDVEVSDVVVTARKETVVETHMKQSSNTLEEVVITTGETIQNFELLQAETK